jgi:hypothetical protein
MKPKGMNEAQFLSLLKKVLPKATKDLHLASAIYDEVAKEVRLLKSIESFEKFCETGALPDIAPETVANFQNELAGKFGEENVALTPDENGTEVAVEIALPDRTISTRVKVDPTVAEEEVKVPFVPFPSRCPRIRSWSGCWRDVRISAPMKRCARWRRSRKSFGRPRKVSSYSAITSRRLSPSSSLTYPPLH